MPARLTAPTVAWQDGALWSVDFADAYASRTGAREERENVFLRGHGFAAEGDAAPGRWAETPRGVTRGGAPAWVFGELGFGAGVSFVAAWAALLRHAEGAHLEWVSVEHAPLSADLLQRAALADPAMAPLAPLVRELAAAWPERVPGIHRRTLNGGRVRLTLLFGGALDLLPTVPFLADAWNLDGFAPARNPEMWSDAMLAQVAQHTRPGATLATFSAESAVRGALAGAGFAVEARASSPGRREMTLAVRAADARPEPEPPQRLPAWFTLPVPIAAERAIVIGAGLAGAAAARSLAERGVRVEVLEAGRVASGGSGAPHALLAPHIARWEGPQCRIVAQAFLHARALIARLGVAHTPCGVLRLVPEDDEWGVEQAIESWGWPQHVIGMVSAAEATRLAGTVVRAPAVWVPDACVLRPGDVVRALLAHPNIALREGACVCTLRRSAEEWRLADAVDGEIGRAPLVVVATAGAWTPVWEEGAAHPRVERGAAFAQVALPDVPFDGTRGQLTLLACPAGTPAAALLAGGFVLPAGGAVCVGATHERGNDDLAATTHDDAENLAVIERVAPDLLDRARVPERTGRWVGLRATVNDHCPVVGPVPDSAAFLSAFARLHHGPLAEHWPQAPMVPGLFATLAHGGRGTGTALLAGELLADIALGGVRCVGDDLLPALLPQRFAVRRLRRAGEPEVG